jgi:putative PIN family toxin of toxin-antitoxin system
MKVVLDTNVLVSGLLWLGPSNKILKLAEEGKLQPCLTPSILEELCQVLDRSKFSQRIKICGASTEELIAGLCELALLFPDTNIERTVKDDPDDDKIIACAKVSGAEYIVTGDPHLLKVKQFAAISFVPPSKFLSRYARE